jgi:hypothetical protein
MNRVESHQMHAGGLVEGPSGVDSVLVVPMAGEHVYGPDGRLLLTVPAVSLSGPRSSGDRATGSGPVRGGSIPSEDAMIVAVWPSGLGARLQSASHGFDSRLRL